MSDLESNLAKLAPVLERLRAAPILHRIGGEDRKSVV